MPNYFKVTIPLAVIITMISVLYQRSTGPTYPKKFNFMVAEQKVKVKLLRSQGGTINAPIQIAAPSKTMTGTVTYKRFPTNDDWSTKNLEFKNNQLVGDLPNQPPAGKLQYFVTLNVDGKQVDLGTAKDPVMIRYKGSVPTWVLAPHIFFMFLSMLLASLCGLEAIKKTKSYPKIAKMTFLSLFIGGMILGPIVQKYAFGVYWAGFPFDWDLTDNKLLIAVIAWVAAAGLNWKKPNRAAAIAAALVLFAIYSIPHSTMGSQYNYEKGQVETDR